MLIKHVFLVLSLACTTGCTAVAAFVATDMICDHEFFHCREMTPTTAAEKAFEVDKAAYQMVKATVIPKPVYATTSTSQQAICEEEIGADCSVVAACECKPVNRSNPE